MRRLTLLGLFLAAAAAAQPPQGHLILIGGGERPIAAMKKFAELAGCPQASVVVLPTASEDPKYVQRIVKSIKDDYGCQNVKLLNLRTRPDASRPDYVEAVQAASGIFFTGGDQTRIVRALAGSPVLAAIRQAYAEGAVVGGTSAGTACMSQLMITGEGNFDVVQPKAVELSPGLGLLPTTILDQHHLARRRFNRLLTVILEHPQLLGIGIDEDTAIWVKPDGTFEVLGASSVLVVDAKSAGITRVPTQVDSRTLFSASPVVLHVLSAGDTFDLKIRQVLKHGALPQPACTP